MNYEKPLLPLISYDPNMPPVMFDINIPEQAKYIIPLIISGICNEATSKATQRPVRMFTYNVLSNNCWNNNEMKEVVTLAILYCILQTNKGLYNRLDFAINDCVKEILALYTSTMMFQNNVVKSVSSPQDISAANENAQIFHNLKGEIHSMMNGFNFNQGFMGNMQPGPGVVNPAMTQRFMQNNNVMQMHNSMGIGAGNASFTNNSISNSSITSVNADTDDRYNRRQYRQEILNQQNIFTEVSSNVNAVQSSKTQNNNNNSAAIAEVDNSGLIEPECEPFTFEQIIISTCLDELIVDARLNQKVNHKWDTYKNNFIKFTGDVIIPVVEDGNVSDLFSEITACNNFYTLCRVLKNYKNEAQEYNRQGRSQQRDSVIAVIDQITAFFTEKINSFLKYEMSTGVTITDFIEDAPELTSYFEKKYNENSISFTNMNRFIHFEAILITSYFANNKSYIANAFDAVGIDYEQNIINVNENEAYTEYKFDSNIGIIKIPYIITLTRLFSRHIDIPVEKIPCKLSKNNKLATELVNTIISDAYPTVTYVLVTRDNVKYKYWLDPEDSDIVFIMKM